MTSRLEHSKSRRLSAVCGSNSNCNGIGIQKQSFKLLLSLHENRHRTCLKGDEYYPMFDTRRYQYYREQYKFNRFVLHK